MSRADSQPILCPVRRLASAVCRIRAHPKANNQTSLCTVFLSAKNKPSEIDLDTIRQTLRDVCRIYGGSQTFGFAPSDIGNKSLRSGAAMALFLNDHSPSKIMILGRWKSDAFLDYIRPQVLEWTSTMSRDMSNFDDFLDLNQSRHDLVGHSDPRLRRRVLTSFNGSESAPTLVIPRFYLHH